MSGFWKAVLENALGNLVTLGVIFVLAAVWTAARFSGPPLVFWRRLDPRRRVLPPVHPAGGSLAPAKVNQPSLFVSPVEGHELVALASFVAGLSAKGLPRGMRCLRLDRLEPRVEVSAVGLTAHLATNVAAFSGAARAIWSPGALGRALRGWLVVHGALARVAAAGRVGGVRPRNVRELLANRRLANVAAVSVLAVLPGEPPRALLGRVRDETGAWWQSTAAGPVLARDLEEGPDPFQAAARRLLRHALGDAAGGAQLVLQGVTSSRAELRPVAAYACRLTRRETIPDTPTRSFAPVGLTRGRELARALRRLPDVAAWQLAMLAAAGMPPAREPEDGRAATSEPSHGAQARTGGRRS